MFNRCLFTSVGNPWWSRCSFTLNIFTWHLSPLLNENVSISKCPCGKWMPLYVIGMLVTWQCETPQTALFWLLSPAHGVSKKRTYYSIPYYYPVFLSSLLKIGKHFTVLMLSKAKVCDSSVPDSVSCCAFCNYSIVFFIFLFLHLYVVYCIIKREPISLRK